MLMIARLFSSLDPAKKAAEALVSAGYDDVVVLPATPASGSGDGDDAAATAPAPAVDTATAVRAGRMLGEHADFYLSRLTDGRALVVAMPPFMDSRRAEEIINGHDPLPDSHLPPSKPFVPLSEQPAPFSALLGLPVLTKSDTPFSDLLGFGFREEGPSHLSRWFPPPGVRLHLFEQDRHGLQALQRYVFLRIDAQRPTRRERLFLRYRLQGGSGHPLLLDAGPAPADQAQALSYRGIAGPPRPPRRDPGRGPGWQTRQPGFFMPCIPALVTLRGGRAPPAFVSG